jgi:hypothetical protein
VSQLKNSEDSLKPLNFNFKVKDSAPEVLVKDEETFKKILPPADPTGKAKVKAFALELVYNNVDLGSYKSKFNGIVGRFVKILDDRKNISRLGYFIHPNIILMPFEPQDAQWSDFMYHNADGTETAGKLDSKVDPVVFTGCKLALRVAENPIAI